MIANPVFRYRMLTLAEGWSFVLLVVSTLVIRKRLGWGVGTTLVALLCAVLPLAPFVFHHWKRDQFLEAEKAAQPANA